jgi:hypothetical protein
VKWQVGEMSSWQNGKLVKWQVCKIESWQTGKLVSLQFEEMASG